MADLPQSGIELVVKNAQAAIRDLKAYQSALGQQNKAVTTAAKTSNNTSQAMQALGKDFSSMGKNILSQIPGVGKLTNLLGGLGGAGGTASGGVASMAAGMSAALPVIGAVAVAVAGITAGFAAFWKLGSAGARLQPTIDAFGNIAGQFGNSSEMLERLREDTKGTISDMELMRIATFALSGTSQELGTILAQNLGKNLNDVGRLATAIGRDPVEAQTRWIDAIKKGERELLDELGIVVSANQAYEAYAESINKSVDSLTAYDKQAAFAQEATRQLNAAVEKLPAKSGVLETLQRIPVVIQNIKDKIALLVQPIFEPIAEVVGAIISRIEEGANNLIYILNPIIKTLGALFSEALQNARAVFNLLFGDMDSNARKVMPYIIASFQIAGDVATYMIRAIGAAFRAFISALGVVRESIGKLFGGVGEDVDISVNRLAFNLAKGGAGMIGGFAAGIIKGGTYVLKAVTAIAQIVADFLVGFSPPKRGPLASIDQGGENVAVSWVDGFMGGIQSSFGAVTAYVNDRLGAIASLSRDQIEQRLAMLDVALRPFRENLAIVKADMEAIAGFTDPAMRMMERQRKNLLKAFGEGKIADVEQLRNLDRQIQRMKELKDFGQDQVDQAELLLALAQSKQAQERALLNIAKDRLGAEQKGAGAGAGERGGGGGGGGADTGGGGGGLDLGGGGAPDLLSTDAIDQAKADLLNMLAGLGGNIQSGFGAGLAESGFGEALAGFKGQSMDLNKQLSRIQDANPVQKIAKKFEGLKDAVSGAFTEFSTFIADTFTNLFGEEGSVMMALNTFKTVFTGIFSGALNPFALANIAISGLVATAQTQLPLLLEAVTTNLTPISEAITDLFTSEESPLFLAKTAVTETIEDMIANFTDLRDDIFSRLSDMELNISAHFTSEDGIISRAKTAVTDMMDSVVNDFLRLTNEGADTLTGALSGLRSVLQNMLVVPFHGALQSIANLIADALRSIVSKLGAVLDLAGVDVTVPQIVIPLPQLAKGTLKPLKSPFIAGEGGMPELIAPARNNPLTAFPGKATAALTSIASMMEKPAPMPQYLPPANYGTPQETNNVRDSYNTQKNVTFNSRYKLTRLERLQLASRS